MSAIAGFWSISAGCDAVRSCGSILDAQAIYGRDDRRLWSDEVIALGRRLHRTVPEDRFDRQPLQTPGGDLSLVADVRLDNRSELRGALGLTPDAILRLSDADVLLLCFERFGEAALERICGDFALALWSARSRTLMLARDFIGARPLHYHRSSRFFAFATMPKGLHALPELPVAPDLDVVTDWLALESVDRSQSFFKGISAVMPGHVVRVTSTSIKVQRYWNPRRPDRAARLSVSDCVEGMRFHLDQAAQAHLRGAEGRVATHLSAGLDSSAVTATAARHLPNGKVFAFTAVPRAGYVGPPSRLADEGPLAATVAALYSNIEHRLVRSGAQSPLSELDRDYFLFDRPQNNLCNMVWIREINRQARECGATILLTGQVGNMSLTYDGILGLSELLLSGRLLKLARESLALISSGEVRWQTVANTVVGRFLTTATRDFIYRQLGKRSLDPANLTALAPALLAHRRQEQKTRRKFSNNPIEPWRDSFDSRLSVLAQLDSGLLNKGTLAGWGIDLRDPTADRRLVEYCLQIPVEHYAMNGRLRALGRHALSDRLPQEILDSRTRGLQAVDWHDGLTMARAALEAEFSRIASCNEATQLLDISRMTDLTTQWPSDADWGRREIVESYRYALLRGVSAGHFVRRATGSNQ